MALWMAALVTILFASTRVRQLSSRLLMRKPPRRQAAQGKHDR
jgi:hypothetical protein